MLSYSVVVLICALNVGRAECQPETAIDVMRGPRADNAMMCGMLGQALVGQTVLAPREGMEYMKIVCVPSDRKIRSAAAAAE